MDIDDFDLPWPAIKEKNSEVSSSNLSLNRNISFGPAKNQDFKEEMKWEPKKKVEEEKSLPKPAKANSIANFLKKNIKTSGQNIFGFENDLLPLFLSKSNEPTLEKKPTFKPIKTILEPEKLLDSHDQDSMDFGDDDMDLDDIPELSLK